jgi:predicted TIM-barrel enzyme
VLAGVNGTDPFVSWDDYFDRLERLGFAGVQNFPTVGLFDGQMRQQLEETGMGYGLEVEMIARAHARGMLTTPYVFNPREAVQMAAAGADIIVVYMGLTAGGSIGAATTPSLDASVALFNDCEAAVRGVRDDVIMICHGGPIAEPEHAAHMLAHCRGCHGFYGASSMERPPSERALTEQTRRFTGLRTTPPGAR